MSKYSELKQMALDILKEDDIIFEKCVDEVIRWDGTFADYEVFSMDELDEMFYGCSLTDFLNKVDKDSFNLSDDYWTYDNQGNIISLDDKAEYYRDNVDEGELLDKLLDEYYHLDIHFIDSELDDILNDIVNYVED